MDQAAPIKADLAPATEKALGPAAILTGLGIVFGDLGTSPLYTYQALVAAAGGHPSATDAIGLLSLVVWALIVTVSIKYCVLVMRADNHGEGGILALMSLVTTGRQRSRSIWLLTAMGLFGAALIYGDGIITPAISVLSALEGINVATTAFKPYVLPAALLVLVGLFAVQPKGTASIGRIFGPVMLLWFAVIALLGLAGILRQPQVLAALDPFHALGFLARHGLQSFIVLGSVFLAVTGGEALYADMGHIGRGPIRLGWYAIVLPALLLNYAGQTALLLENPSIEGNPFFQLAPGWAVIPLVILATFATIIASQAIITGSFSLTRQAMQLGWFPGVKIRQTSDTEYGQIYVPAINWLMMLGTVALAYGFGSSDRLAGAYGTAVSTTMLLTTGLLFTAMRLLWRWPLWAALLVSGLFLLIDLAFFGANLLKLLEGGWIPLVVGAAIYLVMTTWHAGIQAIRAKFDHEPQDPATFLASLERGKIVRTPGTAVFFSRNPDMIPAVLVNHVAQFKSLAETVVDLTIVFEEIPRVTHEQRAESKKLEHGLWQVLVRFGFLEVPNVPAALERAAEQGCPLDLTDAIYIGARDAVVREAHPPRLAAWRRGLFALLYRNAVRVPDRFALPADSFVEVTRQISL